MTATISAREICELYPRAHWGELLDGKIVSGAAKAALLHAEKDGLISTEERMELWQDACLADEATMTAAAAKRAAEEAKRAAEAKAAWEVDCARATMVAGPRPSSKHVPWFVRGECRGWHIPTGSDLRPRYTEHGTGRFD